MGYIGAMEPTDPTNWANKMRLQWQPIYQIVEQNYFFVPGSHYILVLS